MTSMAELHIHSVLECTSTNDLAWAHCQSGTWTGTPQLFMAEHQTKGRGRHGRQWICKASGNILASLLCSPPSQNLEWIPQATGIAAMETLAHLNQEFSLQWPLDDFHLKWPNDLLYLDQKLGGILCESRFNGNQCMGTVIGLGLNITTHPILTNTPTTALRNLTQQPFDAIDLRKQFLKAWVYNLLKWLRILSQNKRELLKNEWHMWAKLHRFPMALTKDDQFLF